MVPTNLSGVIAVAAGGYHSLALISDGTIVAWGDNGDGQSTVPANLTNVIAIAAGDYHSVALKSDGSVVAWGVGLTNDPDSNDDYGQSMVPANLSSVMAIAAGEQTSLALVAPCNQSPALKIQSSGTNVVLSWPWLPSGGFVLEATDDLANTNSWATATNAPAYENYQYSVTNPISGMSRFYRLRR
jgi:hypothetical protein